MRFIYLLLLGLVIFQGMLVTLSPFFPGATEHEYSMDVQSELQEYGNLSSSQMFSSMWATALTAGGAIFGVSLLIGVFSRNLPLFAGIGAFIGLLTGLWVSTASILTPITSYPYVSGLFAIITIATGIIATFSVVEMLTGQGRVS